MTISRIKGTNDILPQAAAGWRAVEALLRQICREFGYGEIRTPVFEETELFQRGVGETTDIVQKEMYTFTDRGGRSLTLRPENTASAARAYLENKLHAAAQPVKLYYIGPMFRSEQPQAGRFRQFHQFGVEVFGSASPLADAEVIALAWEFYRRLGISSPELRLNSVGCPECRPAHKEALREFLKPSLAKLCPTCQGRYERNPLRILDCKNEGCQKLTEGAPTTFSSLCPECGEHFARVTEALSAAGIPYQLDQRLVRGLDYYTKTAFEMLSAGIGAQSALCGGGRYDGLVQALGGEATPAVGFALGLERVFAALKAQEAEIKTEEAPDVFVLAFPAGNAEVSRAAFALTAELRRAGLAVEQDLLGRGMKSQLKHADKLGAPHVVIVGERELAENQVLLREMARGEQRAVPISEVREILLTSAT
ncbi:MAG: histidine--tRNA ligase [Clostridiales bacterium]|nr:histidine--tRNA ligase [Clostridiales bacterium]